MTAQDMHDLLQRCAGAVGLPSDACLLDELVPAIIANGRAKHDTSPDRTDLSHADWCQRMRDTLP